MSGSKPLTGDPDALWYLYDQVGLSLDEIAEQAGCTRQYIYKLFKKYDLTARDRSQARRLALSRGKIRRLHNGELVPLSGGNLDEGFFSRPTNAMAWVLGLLYTDGCFSPDSNRCQLAQSQPEMLEKVKCLLGLDSKIVCSPNGPGRVIYTITMSSERMCTDLDRLGLHAHKSRTITFPELPRELVRHFIRGCWDGDGTVHWPENAGPRRATSAYISGSRVFVEQIEQELRTFGFTPRTIHRHEKSHAFYIKYGGRDTARLYPILYSGVSEELYLDRKYLRFRAVAEAWGLANAELVDDTTVYQDGEVVKSARRARRIAREDRRHATPGYVTTKEAEAILGWSRNQLLRAHAKGILHPEGGLWPRDELEELKKDGQGTD